MAKQSAEEQPIDPQRPIIDPHLHHWEILPAPGSPQLPQRFLFHETLEAVNRSGHNITHTIFTECHAMYRAEGRPEFAPVGETEFANGIAAMSASGGYGPCRFAHRIVGRADLMLGAGVEPVLNAHLAVAGERFRGIRCHTVFSESNLFGSPCDPDTKGVMLQPSFREGARVLGRMGLSLDVWCLHTQLDELISLADSQPELTIILNHIGTPEYRGVYAGRETETRAEWSVKITELAHRPNVYIKLGGMGMDIYSPVGAVSEPASSQILADRWRPYMETCIEAFTARRCMFESNFPPDNTAGSYGAIWNAFKIISRDCSEDEKDWLFRGTAAGVYGISLQD